MVTWRMDENEMTKRVYRSKVEEVRGRPPVKWEDRVIEYVNERGEGRIRGLENAREECKNREKWRLFCRGHPLGGEFLGEGTGVGYR